MPFKSEILREAMMNSTLFQKPPALYSYPQVYTKRRDPILVCPHCKRAVMSFIDIIDGKPFSIYRCKEHDDVVAIWSEVVNEY